VFGHLFKESRDTFSLFFMLFCVISFSQTQISQDDFEGTSSISSWFGDDCTIDITYNNPFPIGINTSAKVLKYSDVGGLYANVRFDAGFNFNLMTSSVFSLKIYVPSNGITGNQNLAVVPGGTIPVSINTVNSGSPSGGNATPCFNADPNWQSNSIYFTTSFGNFSGQGYNGATIAMTALSNLICGETYHIKLAVCNVADQALNSGVYLEGGSFTVDPVEFGFTTITDDNIMLEGCNQFSELIFTRGGCQDNNVALTAYLDFAGTAINGVDYNLLPDSVYFAPGVDTIIWTINPFEDGLTEGQETIDLTVTSFVMGESVVSTATFFINDRPIVDVTGTDLTFVCLQDTTTVSESVPSICCLKRTCLRFKIISVTSSTTPLIVVNS
jgi:hypothetical protein